LEIGVTLRGARGVRELPATPATPGVHALSASIAFTPRGEHVPENAQDVAHGVRIELAEAPGRAALDAHGIPAALYLFQTK